MEKIFTKIHTDKIFIKSILPYAVVGFIYIYLLGIGSMYEFLKDNAISVSNIPMQIVNDGYSIVEEGEFNGDKYIMSYGKKDGKDNLMITSYKMGREYILDLYENIITDKLHSDYVYKGTNGEFINYSPNASFQEEKLMDMMVFIKGNVGDVVELSAKDKKITLTLDKKYMIKKVDLKDLELPQDTVFKINLIKQ